jgi:hypothetical protein
VIDLGMVIAYEQGDLDENETITLFADLVRTGLAWTLQGSYGRTAADMIDAGLLDTGGNILVDLEN